jgi:diaminohydroxyphosphoribosylaminopyrimidine deaminase / 5-amino-6-(5-phosphoribosylamino)uracil reductase
MNDVPPPTDAAYMAAALALGRRNLGAAAPNPAVGALVVKDGVIVGRGATALGGRPHAETLALAAAGEAARGATLYVTLEPCSHHGATPPCVDAILAAGVARVVAAMEDPDPRVAGRGLAILRAGGVAVTLGVGAESARREHLGHILRTLRGRPMVTLKLAQTPDGYAAAGRHDPRLHITGPVADADTHMQRSLHDAIMVGAGTARADDPLLTVRVPGYAGNRRLRVVLDAKLALSPGSRLAQTARESETLILVGDAVPAEARAAFAAATGAEVAALTLDAHGRFDLAEALALLAQRGVTRVFSEGGPRIGSALILAGLADSVVLHTGVKPLGREGRPALSDAARAKLADPAQYALCDDAALGEDRTQRFEKVEPCSPE